MQLTKRHRKAVLATRLRCWYCADVLTRRTRTRDHKIAQSCGGSDDASNIVWACRACNNEKDAMSIEQYRTFLGGRRIVFFGERS